MLSHTRHFNRTINRGRFNLFTEPKCEPVSLEEAKKFLVVDFDKHDLIIDRMIVAVRQMAEQMTKLTFITQEWQVFFDHFPHQHGDDLHGFGHGHWAHGDFGGSGVGHVATVLGHAQDFEFEKPPLQTVTHVKTFDDDDIGTIFDPANFHVRTYKGIDVVKGRIALRNASIWPFGTRSIDAVEIQFKSGYGDSASNVPHEIRQAILEEVAFRYNNRGDCAKNTLTMNPTSQALLTQFRIMEL